MSPAPVDPFPNFVNGTIADADQVDARFLELYKTVNPGGGGNGLDRFNVAGSKWGSDALGPTSGVQSSNAAQAGIGTAFTDVTSSSFAITPTVAGVLLVEGLVFITGSAAGAGIASLALNVDGADQAYVPTFPRGSSLTQVVGALPGLWRVALTAAAHTIKLRAKADAGTIDLGHFALKYLLHS